MNDLEIIYNIQELYEHKVVLFGAGDIGKRIQNQLLLAMTFCNVGCLL